MAIAGFYPHGRTEDARALDLLRYLIDAVNDGEGSMNIPEDCQENDEVVAALWKIEKGVS